MQAAFGKEVSNCCRYMQETTDWKLGRLVVHRDGEKTADFGTKSETRSSIFSSADLGDANGNTHMWQSLEEIVAKYGTATLEAGALYPEADSTLSQAELMEVFQKLIHRSTPAGAATSGHSSVQNVSNYLSSTSERVASASASANQFYSADFKNIKDTSMHSSTSNNGINNGMSRVDSARDAGFSPPSSPFENNRATSGSKSNINKNSSENEFRSPRPANYNTRKLDKYRKPVRSGILYGKKLSH